MHIAKVNFVALQTESTGAWGSGWRRGSSTPTLKGTVQYSHTFHNNMRSIGIPASGISVQYQVRTGSGIGFPVSVWLNAGGSGILTS